MRSNLNLKIIAALLCLSPFSSWAEDNSTLAPALQSVIDQVQKTHQCPSSKIGGGLAALDLGTQKFMNQEPRDFQWEELSTATEYSLTCGMQRNGSNNNGGLSWEQYVMGFNTDQQEIVIGEDSKSWSTYLSASELHTLHPREYYLARTKTGDSLFYEIAPHVLLEVIGDVNGPNFQSDGFYYARLIFKPGFFPKEETEQTISKPATSTLTVTTSPGRQVITQESNKEITHKPKKEITKKPKKEITHEPQQKLVLKELPGSPLPQNVIQNIYDSANPDSPPSLEVHFKDGSYEFEDNLKTYRAIARLGKFLNLHPKIAVKLIGDLSEIFSEQENKTSRKNFLNSPEHAKVRGVNVELKLESFLIARAHAVGEVLMRMGVAKNRLSEEAGHATGMKIDVIYSK